MTSAYILPFAVCVLPILTAVFCLVLLVKGFSIFHGFKSVLLGLVAVLPVCAIYLFWDKIIPKANSYFESFLFSILSAGFIEETVKMLLIFFISYKKNSAFNFFVAAALVGFSMSCFENFVFIVGGSSFVPELPLLLPRIPALFIHTACAGLCGIFVYSIKDGEAAPYSFILAILLHGIYDYFAGFNSGSVFFWFSLVVILAAMAECRIRYRSVISSE